MNNKVRGFRYGDFVKITQDGFYEGAVGRIVGKNYGGSRTFTVLLEHGDRVVVEEREVERVPAYTTSGPAIFNSFMHGGGESGAV